MRIYPLFIAQITVLLLISVGGCQQSADQAERSVSIDTLTEDGAWCWFGDPRAVYYKGQKEQTYFGWITSEGDIMAGSYNHQEGTFSQKLIHKNLEIDDHDNPSIFIRKDGRIIVFYSEHSHGPMFRVISDQPEDIGSFSSPATFGVNVTYPNPFQVGDSIVLFYRGINWHPTLVVSTDDGVSWAEPQQVIRGGGDRPYTKYTQDDKQGIHIASTVGHPRQEKQNKIFYTYYKSGAFYQADGTFIKPFTGTDDALDIDKNEAETVYDATAGKGWIWDIATDDSGYPVMVYGAYPNDSTHNYYYANWDGTTWNNEFVTEAGSWFPQTPMGGFEREPNYSGGIHLDYNQVNRMYLSKPVAGSFEIFRYTYNPENTPVWQSEQITFNTPDSLVNVRPYVPVNHKYFDVMWMWGKYVHYTDYQTAIFYARF